MVGINPLGQEIEDDPTFRAGIFVNRHNYRIKMRVRLASVKEDKNSEIRVRISEFDILYSAITSADQNSSAESANLSCL